MRQALTHVDDLETEIEDRFGPLPLAFRRLLDLARLRITASSLSIDSISKQPGLLVIGHHNIHCIEKWRQHCILSGQEVRVVGNKTVVLPLHEIVLLMMKINSSKPLKNFFRSNKICSSGPHGSNLIGSFASTRNRHSSSQITCFTIQVRIYPSAPNRKSKIRTTHIYLQRVCSRTYCYFSW